MSSHDWHKTGILMPILKNVVQMIHSWLIYLFSCPWYLMTYQSNEISCFLYSNEHKGKGSLRPIDLYWLLEDRIKRTVHVVEWNFAGWYVIHLVPLNCAIDLSAFLLFSDRRHMWRHLLSTARRAQCLIKYYLMN